jgi:hypothetical protein
MKLGVGPAAGGGRWALIAVPGATMELVRLLGRRVTARLPSTGRR